VFQSRGDLPEVCPHSSFVNELLFQLGLLNKLLEVTFFGPFYYDEHFIVFYKALNVSGYEVMLQFLEQFDLFNAFVPLLLIIHIKYLSYAN
jgi:hypothetical protein